MTSIKSLTGAYENRLVAVLTVTFGVVMMDRMALGFLAPFLSEDLGLSHTQVGGLATALALTWAVSGIVFGRICDRIGHHRTILTVAIVAFSLCSFLSGLVGSFVGLLLARLLMGLAEGPVLPISHVLLAEASTPSRRGFNMGVMQMFGSNVLASSLAPILLVWVAEGWGWRTAFFVAGVPGFFCALLVWRTVKSPVAARCVARELVAVPLGEALRRRNIPVCTMIGGTLVGWALLCFVFLPFIFVRVSGFSAGQMSILMSVMGISAVAAGMVVPGLSDRFGRRPVIGAFVALGLLVPLGVALAGSSMAVLLVCLLIGFLATGVTPLVMATIPTETVPGYHATTTVGLSIGVTEILAGLIGPLIGGVLADRYGLSATLWLQVGLLITAFVLSFFLIETMPRRHGSGRAVGQSPDRQVDVDSPAM